MKATYLQNGETLDYVNTTGKDIEASEVVVFEKRIGIAGTNIPSGALGTIHMTGVFRVPKKKGETIEAGADVYYAEDGFTAVEAVGVFDIEDAKVGTAKAGEAAAAESAAIVMSVAGYAVKKAEAEEETVVINLR